MVVLSHALWQRRFGASRTVLGEQIIFNNTSFTIIGVMPAGFFYPDTETEFWTAFSDELRQRGRGTQSLEVIARLKPGVSLEQALRHMEDLTHQINEDFAEQQGGTLGVRLIPLHDEFVGGARPVLLLLVGASALVLLLACANIANLLLARQAGRQRELAIRTALGAGRFRIARQLLAESSVLALLGGSLGMLLAVAGLQPLAALLPRSLPRISLLTIEPMALWFALGASVLTGLIVGVSGGPIRSVYLPAARSPQHRIETTAAAPVWARGGASRHRIRLAGRCQFVRAQPGPPPLGRAGFCSRESPYFSPLAL